jgi:hypothetical protein
VWEGKHAASRTFRPARSSRTPHSFCQASLQPGVALFLAESVTQHPTFTLVRPYCASVVKGIVGHSTQVESTPNECVTFRSPGGSTRVKPRSGSCPALTPPSSSLGPRRFSHRTRRGLRFASVLWAEGLSGYYALRGNPRPGEKVRDASHVDNRGCGGIAPAAAPLSPRRPGLYGAPAFPLLQRQGKGVKGIR